LQTFYFFAGIAPFCFFIDAMLAVIFCAAARRFGAQL